jgi:DnaA family protein
MSFAGQIPLPLEPRRPDRLEDFIAGPNRRALAAVHQLLDEPDGFLVLEGVRGTGKSHLLNAACHAARDRGLGAFYLALGGLPPAAAASLEGLQALDLLCIDDVDRVAGEPAWEEALFRCFNSVRAAGGRLLVSTTRPLSTIDFHLPDLASRLGWGVRQRLRVLDDAGKLTLLQQRAEMLRIDVPTDVQQYLLKHGKRDPASLLAALERLKDAAFSEKRRITVPLARRTLERLQEAPTPPEPS